MIHTRFLIPNTDLTYHKQRLFDYPWRHDTHKKNEWTNTDKIPKFGVSKRNKKIESKRKYN